MDHWLQLIPNSTFIFIINMKFSCIRENKLSIQKLSIFHQSKCIIVKSYLSCAIFLILYYKDDKKTNN